MLMNVVKMHSYFFSFLKKKKKKTFVSDLTESACIYLIHNECITLLSGLGKIDPYLAWCGCTHIHLTAVSSFSLTAWGLWESPVSRFILLCLVIWYEV